MEKMTKSRDVKTLLNLMFRKQDKFRVGETISEWVRGSELSVESVVEVLGIGGNLVLLHEETQECAKGREC